jgi:ubiquinone/menaquinone biosynthesis C-methylase UbiE
MAVTTQIQRIAEVGYDYGGRQKEEVRSCNLCGHETFALLTDRDRYGFPARTHLCLGCGLGVMSPHLTPEEYGDFYAHWYRPLCNAMTGKSPQESLSDLMDDQAAYARWLHSNLLVRFIRPEHRSLFDIGGSTGIVASYVARQHPLEAVVLDPSEDELKQAREAGCRGVHGLWEQYEPGDETYDIVLLCRTIDHLLDIHGSLRKARRIVRDGGLFFVDIVDFSEVARNCGCISRATKIDHVYYLTHQPMLGYLQSVGFEPVAVDVSRNERIGYLCRPVEPRPFTPDPAYATQLLSLLQNLPRQPRRKPQRNHSLVARGMERLLRYVR